MGLSGFFVLTVLVASGRGRTSLLSSASVALTDEVWSVTRPHLDILRKEVIQPQVPLRLPCYDLVPIVELTFGTCLPCGLAQ